MTIGAQEQSVNERIRAFKVLVIDDEGNKVGVMLTKDAIGLARERGLDLVEVAPQADPPVARIMDFGKFLYTQQKRERDARKKQAAQQLREIKMRTKTEEHDLKTKLKKVVEFLEDGDRVKIRVVYRGREMAHPELGHQVLERIIKEVEDYGSPVDKSEMQGRSLLCVIAPFSKEQITKKLKAKKAKPEEPTPEEAS